jgi:hypothetical protein
MANRDHEDNFNHEEHEGHEVSAGKNFFVYFAPFVVEKMVYVVEADLQVGL